MSTRQRGQPCLSPGPRSISLTLDRASSAPQAAPAGSRPGRVTIALPSAGITLSVRSNLWRLSAGHWTVAGRPRPQHVISSPSGAFGGRLCTAHFFFRASGKRKPVTGARHAKVYRRNHGRHRHPFSGYPLDSLVLEPGYIGACEYQWRYCGYSYWAFHGGAGHFRRWVS